MSIYTSRSACGLTHPDTPPNIFKSFREIMVAISITISGMVLLVHILQTWTNDMAILFTKDSLR